MVMALRPMASLTAHPTDMVLQPMTTMDHPAVVSQTEHPMDTVLQPLMAMDLPATVNQTEHLMDTVLPHKVPQMVTEDHPTAMVIQMAAAVTVALMGVAEGDKMVDRDVGMAVATVVAQDRMVLQMATELPQMVNQTVPPMGMALLLLTATALPPMVNQTVHPMLMALPQMTTMDLPAMVNPTVPPVDMVLLPMTIMDLPAMINPAERPMDSVLPAPMATELQETVRMARGVGATVTGEIRIRTTRGGARTAAMAAFGEEEEEMAATAMDLLTGRLSSHHLIRDTWRNIGVFHAIKLI